MSFSSQIERLSTRPVQNEITVLIPTLGRDLLTGCLLSIAEGSTWPACLVVVDQSSSDKIAGWLENLSEKGLKTRHIPSNQKGVAAARNRGLEQITTRFVVITDDDCLVEPNWLAQTVSFVQARPHAILTGSVKPGGEGVVVSITTATDPAKYMRPLLYGDVLFAGNMACAMEIFEKIGSFDEREFLRVAEDNDWQYRALRSGIPIHYEPSMCVTHLDWRDADQLKDTYHAYARSQGGVYGKYLHQGDWFIALRTLVEFTRALRRYALGVIRRDQDKIEQGKAYLIELLPGILAGWRAEANP